MTLASRESLDRHTTSYGTGLNNLLEVFQDDLLVRRIECTWSDIEVVLAHKMEAHAQSTGEYQAPFRHSMFPGNGGLSFGREVRVGSDHEIQLMGPFVDPVLFRLLSALEGRPCVQTLNKVDRLSPERLEAVLARLTPLTPIPISAKTGYGIERLKSSLISSLPQGPWLYPPDYVTDLNEKILAAEITREVLFLRLRQELPYALTVETEIWQDLPDESARLFQTIYVEKPSQKAIILSGIKSISQHARLQIQEMAERPIHLKLFVKVRPRWKQDRERYENMGLIFPKR